MPRAKPGSGFLYSQTEVFVYRLQSCFALNGLQWRLPSSTDEKRCSFLIFIPAKPGQYFRKKELFVYCLMDPVQDIGGQNIHMMG
jgi:hypothetical protein